MQTQSLIQKKTRFQREPDAKYPNFSMRMCLCALFIISGIEILGAVNKDKRDDNRAFILYSYGLRNEIYDFFTNRRSCFFSVSKRRRHNDFETPSF